MVALIKSDLPHICTPNEREYVFDNSNEMRAFQAFMVGLGYTHTGVYVSDLGKTVIFYTIN